MFGNLCWGVIILLLGLSIIAKALFGFSFPIFKAFIGLLFIYMGIVMIFNLNNGKSIVRFGTACFQDTFPARKYSVVFGKGTIDLSRMEMPETATHMKISTVFGESKIILNKDIPTRITVNSIFADTELPYDQIRQVSSNTYQLSNETPILNLEVTVVFGKTMIHTA